MKSITAIILCLVCAASFASSKPTIKNVKLVKSTIASPYPETTSYEIRYCADNNCRQILDTLTVSEKVKSAPFVIIKADQLLRGKFYRKISIESWKAEEIELTEILEELSTDHGMSNSRPWPVQDRDYLAAYLNGLDGNLFATKIETYVNYKGGSGQFVHLIIYSPLDEKTWIITRTIYVE